MTAESPPVAATRERGAPIGGGGFSWAALFFLGPAALLLGAFLVFPTIYTLLLSFNRGRGGEFSNWVGLDNWIRLFTQDPDFLRLGFPPSGSLWNNVLWIVFYVSLTVLFGLIIAVMATRVRYEAWIKAIVFLPQAIAATSLAIIWRFVYSPDEETGLMNAILGIADVGPLAVLGNTSMVNWALIAVGIWGSVGFATVILSAAIKGISSEVLEAARVDGATETQIFWRVIVPMVSLPISVVAVTLVVNVIKLFDLIYVMTDGGPGTASRVIAFKMYQEAFPQGQFGYGATIAIVMLLLLIPVMIFNIRRFRAEAVQQ
jgi:alpha-glucoside transport system permease protein